MPGERTFTNEIDAEVRQLRVVGRELPRSRLVPARRHLSCGAPRSHRQSSPARRESRRCARPVWAPAAGSAPESRIDRPGSEQAARGVAASDSRYRGAGRPRTRLAKLQCVRWLFGACSVGAFVSMHYESIRPRRGALAWRSKSADRGVAHAIGASDRGQCLAGLAPRDGLALLVRCQLAWPAHVHTIGLGARPAFAGP